MNCLLMPHCRRPFFCKLSLSFVPLKGIKEKRGESTWNLWICFTSSLICVEVNYFLFDFLNLFVVFLMFFLLNFTWSKNHQCRWFNGFFFLKDSMVFNCVCFYYYYFLGFVLNFRGKRNVKETHEKGMGFQKFSFSS